MNGLVPYPSGLKQKRHPRMRLLQTDGPYVTDISPAFTLNDLKVQCMGVFGKSPEKILVEIIELQPFLDNTNTRQTGKKYTNP